MNAPETKRLGKTKSDYFFQYEEIHRHPTNKLTHYFGIPMIVVGILGLLSHLTFGEPAWLFNFAFVLWAFAASFYLKLDRAQGTLFSLLLLGLYFLSKFFSVYVLIGLFVIGWILQLIGHSVYEKKAPAFTDNLLHLLVGPFWIFDRIVKK